METMENQLQTVTTLESSHVNESFLQIKHANYTQLIKWHQLPSVLFESYNQSVVNANLHLHVDTMFLVKFYGEYYKSVNISSNEDFLAIRWPNLSIYDGDEKEMNQKGMNYLLFSMFDCFFLIHYCNNAIFLLQIPIGLIMDTGNSLTDNKLYFPMKIRNTAYYPHYRISSINIPISMIQSGTLMEFIPNPICSEQTSCSACLRHGVFDRKCYWCPNIKKCTTMYDTNRELWIRGQCSIENLTNCSNPFSVKISFNESSSHPQTSSPVNYSQVNPLMKFTQHNLLNDTNHMRGFRTNRTVDNDMEHANILLHYFIPHKDYYLLNLLIVLILLLSIILVVVVCIVLCNSCLLYFAK
ncbi:hypothetical protein MN116_002571 [Schistosoma mekongi]|uniref:PSI domain-containing protein n=1 Tax=Schistosoma mekongi TaxID=38744 RepID=A0AAE1ZGL4_SCHME|nr:hypothetical protein MN116_002571 [Schistosoma mekongi]